MKPQLLKIPLNPDPSFSAPHDIVPVFYKKWHCHKEVELVCFVKVTGTQLIGYDIKHFRFFTNKTTLVHRKYYQDKIE